MPPPSSAFRKPASSGLTLKRYAPVVGVTVLLTLAISNFLKPQPISDHRPHGQRDFLPSSHTGLLEAGGDGSRQSPRWELPEDWKRKIVAAVPMSTAGMPWVKAGRAWRRGVRTAFVTDFYPTAEQILDGGTHGETFVFLNTSNVPYHYYGKAAMVPSTVSEHFGDTTYEWLLYGDDDTVWFMDSVVDIISKLDPNLPWMITDHFWFWRKPLNSGPVHPAFDAPRCVPCGYNKSQINVAALGFDPPQACPYCTVDMLCKADARKELYVQEEGKPCTFNFMYPQDGEYLAHGGGGMILSVGLMRILPVAYMLDCIQNKFSPDKVFGGDTLFHHCILFKGIAPTDPGHYTWDQGFNGFDPGGQLVGGRAPWHGVRSVVDLFYGYLKKGCCDGLCEARLKALTTLHLRGMHFKEPEAAMEYMRLLVDLRDLYVHVRDKGLLNGGHPALPDSWDNHKVCA